MEDWHELFNDPMESAGAFMARASRMKGNLTERLAAGRGRVGRLFAYAERTWPVTLLLCIKNRKTCKAFHCGVRCGYESV